MVNINPERFWEIIGSNENARDSFLIRDTEEEYLQSGKKNAERFVKKAECLDVTVEYGSGDGRVASFVAPKCKEFYCVDIAASVLGLARKRLEGYGFSNVKYKLATEFKDKEFADFVYSYQVIQHNPVDEQFRIMQRIYSYLKPGGRAYVHLAALETKPEYVNSDTCMCFTKEEAEALASSVEWEYTLELNYDYFVWARKPL